MKKVVLLVGVLVFIAAGWFLYFNGSDATTIVGLHKVKQMNLENALEFSGEVAPVKIYSVMSETGGTVAKVSVAEGSRVNAGDVVFVLDSTQVETQLKEARLKAEILRDACAKTVMAQGGGAAQQKAKLALALSQTTGFDFESYNETFGKQTSEQIEAVSANLAESLSGLGFDSATADAPLEKQIELADLAIEQLEHVYNGRQVKSNISGTVIALNINTGEVLAPGLPAMVIADTQNTVIAGYVYEKDLKDLKPGMNVIIDTDSGRYKGTLTKIGAAAVDIGDDISSFETMAKVEIQPEEGFSKMLGSAVDIKIVLSSKENVLAIPVDCLTDDQCVYVVGKDDTAQKRAIVVGFEDTFYIEVVGGLAQGERIVIDPKNIEEGQRLNYDKG